MNATLIMGIVTAIATVVIAGSAIVSTRLTKALVEENRRLRQAGTEPKVIAYLSIDRRHKTCLNIVIGNVGNGPAYNVEIGRDADEDNFNKFVLSFRQTPSRPPIPVLPPGDQIETFLNVGHELFDDEDNTLLKPFTIIVNYENTYGKKETTTQKMDVSAFKGLVTLGTPAEHEIADALTKISKSIQKIITPQGRVKIETMTKDDVHQELQAIREEAEEKRGKRNG
ncbi:hypothetical protein [Rhodovibrio salinarum]|uniref:hypothetical protein n=1 Tax=Rhodovibrio salinarum TaxID=1087 RepID=UPI0012DDF698|nr:hypothetical protein [Rhodovibrio salinarum]